MKPSTSKGRTHLGLVLVLFLLFLLALIGRLYFRLAPELRRPATIDPAFQIAPAIVLASLPTAARFDFPIGSENGALAYNAQPFTENRHLGDDLNGIGGENSDLGDPIYAVADGQVLFAEEAGPGWGKVIIVLHAYEENGERKYVQSYYAHCRNDPGAAETKSPARRTDRDGRQCGWKILGAPSFRDAGVYHAVHRAWVSPGNTRLDQSHRSSSPAIAARRRTM